MYKHCPYCEYLALADVELVRHKRVMHPVEFNGEMNV